MKKMVLVNDLSGLGNCSLGVNLAVFSAMGIQGCAIPTAVLTNQSCYPAYQAMPYQANFLTYAHMWTRNDAGFDGVYSGYFRNAPQMEDFEAAFLTQTEYPYFNDPVMGDQGVPYDNCDQEMLEAMRRLISRCELTTPNLTELCLLTDTDYQTLIQQRDRDDYLERIGECANCLLAQGAARVIVTGIHGKGNRLYNLLAEQKGVQCPETPLLKGNFSGTGDLFSSIVSGSLLLGRSALDGIQKATELIGRAIVYTQEELKNENDGLHFQPFLNLLTEN